MRPLKAMVCRTEHLGAVPHRAYRMIQHRAANAYFDTKVGCHNFRSVRDRRIGDMRNGGELEVARVYGQPKTRLHSQPYDRKLDKILLLGVERISI